MMRIEIAVEPLVNDVIRRSDHYRARDSDHDPDNDLVLGWVPQHEREDHARDDEDMLRGMVEACER
jgi:hypothetical protein